MRRSSTRLIGLLALAIIAIGCGSEYEKVGGSQFAASTWFGNLTQAQRNQYILDRAWQDNGNYVGLNCKEWARRVVNDASNWQASIPSTCPDPNDWQWCNLFDVSPIWYMQAGYIIQMTYGSGNPHTAIVAYINYGTNQLQLIESNWSPPNGLTVNNRWMTISNFNASYSNHSFYVVIGH